MKTDHDLKIFRVALCLVCAGAFAMSACGGGGKKNEDADADVEVDPAPDTDGDTGTDPGVDPGTDPATDPTIDPTTDPIADPDADGEGCIDVDGDGACSSADCDDESPAVHPGAEEVCGNGIDDNCDGTVDENCLGGGTGYYVDRDSIGGSCSDSNPGTLTEPWCTVGKANETLAAGDTVYIRAGTYSEETIEPENSGTSESDRITYTAYEDETVTFTGSVYCIRIQEKSYVTVLDIKFIDCERNLYITASSHVNVGYCSFDNPGGPVTWAGSRIGEGSTYNRIYSCVFSRYGNETYYADDWQDTGCILDIGNDNEVDASDYNLVAGSTFFYGGHHILGVYANSNVVRGNTFHNEEWYACHRPEIGGLCGDRNVILNTSFPDANIRNVIEGNMIVFSGVPPDQESSVGISVRTQYNIVRRNVLYDNDSAGIGLSADGGNYNNPSNNYIYGNTLYHNGYILFSTWDPEKYGLLLARWVDDAEHNPMTGVGIKNNIFYQNQLGAIYFYYVNEEEQDVQGNWEEEGDPGFVSISGTADPFNFSVFDFHLQAGSPCVDTGVFLTRTTGAGTDSTTLAVEQAGYFTDGNGLVEGDMIQLEGQATAVTVSDVDYAANTLTVDTPLSWASGTGVGLPYHGGGPDRGPFEREP
jgi:hypothetical protein